jgi:hypothetical protein
MDILKQLADWIPKAPLYGRFLFFLVGTSVLAWYAFLYQPADVLTSRRKIEQKQAIAFLLGWETIVSLFPPGYGSSPKTVSIERVSGYMKQLGIELEHPPAYYLQDTDDGGARAQEFRERVYGRLEATIDKDTANYFGFATNLLVSISRNISTSDLGSELKAAKIELPEPLRNVPETDHLAWANQVYGYFAAKMVSPDAI